VTAFGAKKYGRQSIYAGQRTRPRSKVSLPGNLVTPAKSQSVVLVDVSVTGAKVSGTNLPAAGEFVRLSTGKSIVFGTVAWCEDEECGLTFDHRLTDAEVAEFQQAAEEAQCLGLSPDMMRAKADWSNGL